MSNFQEESEIREYINRQSNKVVLEVIYKQNPAALKEMYYFDLGSCPIGALETGKKERIQVIIARYLPNYTMNWVGCFRCAKKLTPKDGQMICTSKKCIDKPTKTKPYGYFHCLASDTTGTICLRFPLSAQDFVLAISDGHEAVCADGFKVLDTTKKYGAYDIFQVVGCIIIPKEELLNRKYGKHQFIKKYEEYRYNEKNGANITSSPANVIEVISSDPESSLEPDLTRIAIFNKISNKISINGSLPRTILEPWLHENYGLSVEDILSMFPGKIISKDDYLSLIRS